MKVNGVIIVVVMLTIFIGGYFALYGKDVVQDYGQINPHLTDCNRVGAGKACDVLLEYGIEPRLYEESRDYRLAIESILKTRDISQSKPIDDFTHNYAGNNGITLPEEFTRKWPKFIDTSTKYLQLITNSCNSAQTLNSSDCKDLLNFGVSPEIYWSNKTYMKEIFNRASSAELKNDRSIIEDLDVYTHEFAEENGISLPQTYTKRWPKPE